MTDGIDRADTDAALVTRARGGDQAAFREIVARYQRPVYQLSYRLCGNAADAEDVRQETFLLVFRKLRTFRAASRFSTWIYRIATNAALMHRRGLRRRPTESLNAYQPEFRRDGRHKRIDVDYSAASRIERALQKQQLSRIVLDALQRLPRTVRVAVVLCDLEEMSAAAAAEILDVNPAAIRQRVHRGRLLLRGYLDAVAREAMETRA
jgi:RNA polymerase sigma-70 factor (ECF subfamily)